MGIYGADQNKTSRGYESGTYGSVIAGETGQWIGFVQDFSPDDNQNIQRIRYHGTETRSVNKSIEGAEDYGGTVEYYPADLRGLMFALGNCADTTTGSPAYYTHTISQLNNNDQNPFTSGVRNPFSSYQVESIQQFNPTGLNFGRLYKGCVTNSFTLSAEQGLPITASEEFYAQDMVPFSGAGSFAPSEPTRRPYIWSDSLVSFPSGTSPDCKTWELVVGNNFNRENAHVCNGSRVMSAPKAEGMDDTLTITMDGESSKAMQLYGIWKSGGLIENNGGILLNNFGGTSGATWIALSGCDIDAFDAPNPSEGTDEWSLTIIPKNVSAIVQDQTVKYLAW